MRKPLFYIIIILLVICGIFAANLFIPGNDKKEPYPTASVENTEKIKPRHEKAIADRKPVLKTETVSATDDVIDIDSVETYERLSQYGKLPRSLQGTQIDGDLAVDQNGKLIISPDIRRLFDYFLSAAHEEGTELSISRIKEYIQLTLPHEAENEALNILYGYLDYKNNLKRFNHEGLSELSKSEALDQLKTAIEDREALRRQYMSQEVVDAFFAAEEAYDHYNLSRMEIEYNETLNDAEKKEMIAQLDEQLPEGLRERRRYMTEEAELKNQIAELQQQEGSEDKIYELREKFYGKKAADGLAELDKQRKDLKNRFNAYYESKKRILNSPDLTDEEKRNQINHLKQESFSKAELVRIDIYEKIRDQEEAHKKETKNG
jgi:lipase chaperone LimK